MCKPIAPIVTGACLFLAIAAMAADTTARSADEKDKDIKLSLSSGYGHGLAGARAVHLAVTLDDKGGGKGILILDPNFKEINQFGDFTGKTTAILVRELKVTFEEVKVKDQRKRSN